GILLGARRAKSSDRVPRRAATDAKQGRFPLGCSCMSLASGVRLGPYEIVAPLGAGGMGEGYRGRDPRLDRTVAIKILPTHLSDRADARARFEREAKAISSLSHPNICQLYDVGSEGETRFLVMEYLEGETLADRLGKGPLPLEEVLRYGRDLCE